MSDLNYQSLYKHRLLNPIFLKPLKEQGIKSIGIEPAKNVAKIANSNNLTTLPEYFSENSVKKIKVPFKAGTEGMRGKQRQTIEGQRS